ncbi:hypothetical protein QQ045_010472 [Rhodiola kirilowii]
MLNQLVFLTEKLTMLIFILCYFYFFRKSTTSVGNMSTSDETLDRISNLHNNLKEMILVRLPLGDAVKTSLLSRTWRHIWTKIQCLKFDESVLEIIGSINTEARFSRIIQKILLLHQGPLMHFFVSIPDHFDATSLDSNGWFISLSRKNLYTIHIVYGKSGGGPFLSIPSHFFDFGGQLVFIDLEYCAFRPPPNFQGFYNLVELELCRIDTTSKELSDLISRCPKLQVLTLLDILESFSEPLIIRARDIRVLHFEDYISGMIILKDTSCLMVATLECFPDVRVLHKKAYTTLELLCSLSAVQKLIFDLPLLEPIYGDFPNHLKKEFVALKTLTLRRVNICSRVDLLFTFSLLRSSPNLKTLNIYLQQIEHNDREEKVSVECLEVEGRKGYYLSHLLNVKISGITGLRCETMLVNAMLTSCPLLRTLRVEPGRNIEIAKEMKMRWELNRCTRLSRDVELVYFNSKAQL